MKRFTRYYQDEAFRGEVDEQVRKAREATKPGVWITYAIHDPSREDHVEGRPDGLVIYVGQSKNLGKRVPKRMRSAGSARERPKDRIDGLLYDIMDDRGPAPRWSVLEEVTSAIESLASETNWARRLSSAGYPITNKWAEHKTGLPDADRYAVPHLRLWSMTVADAVGSGIDVILRDNTGSEIAVDFAAFPPSTRLQIIKAHASSRGLRARLHVR